MGDTQILPSPLLFRRYVTSGLCCFDFYRLPEDLVYVELNVKESNRIRTAVSPPMLPISKGEGSMINVYLLEKGANPFSDVDRAEEHLKKGFRIIKKIDL